MANKTEYFDFLTTVVIDGVSLKNIYQRLNFIYTQINSNEDLLLNYTLSDDESPEDLAIKFYRDKKYYWILLIINNIRDYFYDWLLSYDELKNLANKYYNTGYTLGYSNVADLLTYLETENENKRTIKYLNPKYMNDFLKLIKSL